MLGDSISGGGTLQEACWEVVKRSAKVWKDYDQVRDDITILALRFAQHTAPSSKDVPSPVAGIPYKEVQRPARVGSTKAAERKAKLSFKLLQAKGLEAINGSGR